MNFAVQRLNEGIRIALAAHFVALPVNDRRLRFGSTLGPTGVDAYVDGIDFERDAVFGVHDDSLVLIGVAHLAFEDDRAELGLSVLPAYRGCGVGSALFERAVAHARSRRAPGLFMHCLWGNAPIMRIAQKFRMKIVASAGEADAHLELQPASPPSIAVEAGDPVGFNPVGRDVSLECR